MAKITDTVQAVYQKAKAKAFPPDVLRRAAQAGALEQVEQERRRIFARLDRSGRPLPKPSRRYSKRKVGIIFGRIKIKDRKTKYKAETVADVARLSGRTLLDRIYKVAAARSRSDGFNLEWSLGFRSDRSQKIAGYLEDKGIDAYGPARRGSAQAKKESAAISKAIIDALRTTGTVTISTR